MSKVTVEALADEMIVAKDVYDSRDRLLLKKGAVLSRAIRERLQIWGIKEVYVADPESDADLCNARIEARRVTEMIEELERKFSIFTDNKLMDNLKEVIKEYLQEKLAG